VEVLLDRLQLVTRVGGVWVERESRHLRRGHLDRLALLAAWSPTGVLSRSGSRLIGELQRNGYRVVVCSTSSYPAPIRVYPGEPVDLSALTVVRRPNIGYDFGSWAVLMQLCSDLLGADKVLVLNDSLIGPFDSLEPVIADFESTSADVWGMVESGQVTDHLQSYFRGFRYGCLTEPAMRSFWRNIRVIDDKKTLIGCYEYGFAPLLKEWNYSVDCFVDYRGITGRAHNPTIAGWRNLLAAGVPFVKRELVRRPDLVPDGHEVGPLLRQRYGVELSDWL
jgi:hypothetical protein